MLAPASLADSGSAASSDSTADSNANANANSKSILALQQTLLAATRKPQSFKASVVEMHRTASGRGLGEALGQGLEGSQQDNTEDNIDTNDDIDDDDEPMSELQCALEVGQYLLDQNTDLEAALRASRGETEWLLSVLANIDPDLVTEAMAAVQEEGGEQGSMVDKVAVAQEASGVSKLKAELMIAASELDELREQVEEMTTRNTELRLQNLEILMQHDTLKESINKRISTASGIPVEPSHTADLEDRIKEYDILVHQLKTQLAASRKQIADLKTGLKTPIATASPQSMASETSNLARISEPEGSRRMIPQQPHTPPYHSETQNPDTQQQPQQVTPGISNSSFSKETLYNKHASSILSPENTSIYNPNTRIIDNNILGASVAHQDHFLKRAPSDVPAPISQQQHHHQQRDQSSTMSSTESLADRSSTAESYRADDWDIQPSTSTILPPLNHQTGALVYPNQPNNNPPQPYHQSNQMVPANNNAAGMVTVQNVTTHVEQFQITQQQQQQQQLQTISATNVNVIVRLMVGAYLLKYNRRRTKCERRFVNVNPYSRTISWSKSEPGNAGNDEVTTVYMQTVFVEDLTDGRSRIVVSAANREVVFQCSSALEHAIWERGLTLILQNQSKTVVPY